MDTVAGMFYGQDLTWLKQHQVELRNALSAISLGKSYTIQGRQVTREDYNRMADALSAVTAEVNRQEAIANGSTLPGSGSRVVYADFSQTSNL